MSTRLEQRTPLVTDRDGNCFVDVRAIMHELVPFADALAISTFSDDDRIFLRAEDAILWIRKELRSVKYYGGASYNVILECLEKFLRQEGKPIPA